MKFIKTFEDWNNVSPELKAHIDEDLDLTNSFFRLGSEAYAKLFEEFILEGGWSTVKTQNTIITPQVIADTVKIMDKISTGFNLHLMSLDLPSLDALRPVGSGTWWEDDLQSGMDKVYGDVDFMIAYPTLKLTDKGEREDEIATVKLYNDELFKWLESEKLPEVDIEESKKMSSPTSVKLLFVINLKDGETGYVQIDLVVTHKEYAEWSLFRFTPVKNVKGFVLGNLYSSFGEVLDLSIQTRGVRAKFENSVMQPWSKRKNTTEELISADANGFIDDIARFFWAQSGTTKPYQQSDSLKSWPGMDPNDPKIETLIDGISAMADTLQQLGEFGTTIKFQSKDQLLKAVANRYTEKMMTTYNSSKFNKAQSDEAKATIKKIRALIEKYIKLVKSKLK